MIQLYNYKNERDVLKMKLLKNSVILLLTFILAFSMVATALAAPNDDMIQALKDAKIPSTYIIQAENYLKTRELTQAEADAAIIQIKKAADIMEKAGTKDLTKLSADKQQILAIVVDAGAANGITISIKKGSNGTYTISGADSTGKEVINFSSKEVKQTGSNDILLLLGAVFMITAAGSIFAIKRYVSATTTA